MMNKITKEQWQILYQNIKMQKSLIRNGKTPHIRDQAKYRLKLIMEQKKKYQEAHNANID